VCLIALFIMFNVLAIPTILAPVPFISMFTNACAAAKLAATSLSFVNAKAFILGWPTVVAVRFLLSVFTQKFSTAANTDIEPLAMLAFLVSAATLCLLLLNASLTTVLNLAAVSGLGLPRNTRGHQPFWYPATTNGR
jgi:hypothetical protein